jgi:hypothetical protein
MFEDPKLINSRHNGSFNRDGVTFELCIYRLANTNWTLEVVDADGMSTVWDDEFETDDDAHADQRRSVARRQRGESIRVLVVAGRGFFMSGRGAAMPHRKAG